MLYEFAVEPGCLADWQTCRYVIDHMGVSHGRMIAEFPKRKLWKKLVRQACDAADVDPRERKRIIEKVESVGKKMLRARRSYDEAREWLDNALEANRADPFHAILAREGAGRIDGTLSAEAVDEDEPKWRVRREDKVPRTAEGLAQFVKPLLQVSSQIRFVDKLFDPEAHGGKWRPMLEHCLLAAVDGDRRLDSVEYHTVITGDRRPTLAELQRRCRVRLPRLLPAGVRLRVVFWRQPGDDDSDANSGYEELFHARYILTNRGGYRVETGLDVGEPGQHQDVSLLDEPLREQRWVELGGGSTAFEYAGDLWLP